MFGRQPKEPKDSNPLTNSELSEMMYSSPNILPEESDQNDTEITYKSQVKSGAEQPEVVNIVEKISGILSPYFIVLVGLFLYEDNFLIGIILIALGIFSLLKISWQDMGEFIQKAKQILGLDD
jgi:hypothetical protein